MKFTALLAIRSLSTLAATLPLTMLINSPAYAAAPQVRTQAPGFYRMMLGDFEITALLDGTHPFQAADLLTKASADASDKRVKFFEVAKPEADALLAAAYTKTPTESSINAFLINTGTQLVLIDSGVGSLYGPCCGHLLENLRAAGYQPEQVDYVFLTHLHRDHMGGIAPNGVMAFPNAVVRANKADADYWLDERHEKAASSYIKPIFAVAKASLQPYIAAQRFQSFSGEQILLPGIKALPAPGHTPGHTLYVVESKGAKLVLWGDVVHVAAIQFTDPTVSAEYDSNAQQAQHLRESLFDQAVQQGFWVGAAHISFPGLGHVGKSEGHFVWRPADYVGQLPSSNQ